MLMLSSLIKATIEGDTDGIRCTHKSVIYGNFK